MQLLRDSYGLSWAVRRYFSERQLSVTQEEMHLRFCIYSWREAAKYGMEDLVERKNVAFIIQRRVKSLIDVNQSDF